MATGVAAGFSFDNNFIKKLEQLDVTYASLIDKQNQLGKSAIDAFQKMQSGGILKYIDDLKSKTAVLSNIRVNIAGNEQFKTLRDEIDTTIRSITSLNTALRLSPQYGQALNNAYNERARFYEQWINQEYAKEQESIRTVNEAAKQKSLAVQQDYESRLRAYEKMFDAIKAKEQQDAAIATNKARQGSIQYQEEYRQRERFLEQWINQEYAKEQESIRTVNEAAKQKSKDASKAYENTMRAYDKMFREIEKKEKQRQSAERRKNYSRIQAFGDTTGQATAAYYRLYMKGGVKSINQMNSVMQKLQAAQSKLNLSTKDGEKKYAQLAKQIKNVENSINKAKDAGKSFRDALKETDGVAGRLGQTLLAAFSIRSIVGYVQSIAKVRGEFELQHKALTALVKDQDEANKLWNKTVALAVRSPYRVKELVTYTKQLSAYRIESDKLYDTTKMLADIASGLGVDMNRLILAYGQVKAANYLRGTELRQFSEAGINILDELAQYYTALEGVKVTVGDVFERVSKRRVLFADVEAVLKKVTDEGGAFYRMQDLQAETLKGMMSNLKDSIDLMLNDIGQANETALKGMIATAQKAIENWRELLFIIESIAALLAVKGIATFATGFKAVTTSGMTAALAMHGLAGAGARARVSLGALWELVSKSKFGIWGALASVIGAVVLKIVHHNQAVKAANKVYDEAIGRQIRFNEAFEDINDKIAENNAVLKDSNTKKEAANEATKANADLIETLSKKYPYLTQAIKQNEDGTINMTTAIEMQNEALIRNIALHEQAKGSFWQEGLTKNYNDAIEKRKKRDNRLIEVQSTALELEGQGFTAGASKLFIDALAKLRHSTNYEEAVSLFEEVRHAYRLLDDETKKEISFAELINSMQKLNRANENFKFTIQDLLANINNQMDTYKLGIKSIYEDIAKPNEAAVAAGDFVQAFFDEAGIIDETMREQLRAYISKKVGKDITFAENGPRTYGLEDWQIRVNEAITEINKRIKEKNPEIAENMLYPLTTYGQTFDVYKAQMESFFEIATRKYADAQQVYDKLDIAQTKALNPEVSNVKEVLNIFDKGSNNVENFATKLVQGIADAHKEFVKLNEDLSLADAKTQTLSKYADVVKESAKAAGMTDIALSKIDFTNEASVISVIEDILKRLPETEEKARIAIQKILADLRGEQFVRGMQKSTEELMTNIENMFGQYELSLELEKLDFPPSLAQDLFGIETVDLSDIREKIESELQAARMAEGGQERIEKLEEQLTKVNEMEQKAQLERLKTYTKYLLEEQHERVKIEMETLRKIREVDELYNQGKYSDEQYNTIVGNIRKEGDKELAKQTWKSFESTDMYLSLFEDMDKMSKGALESMKSKLDAMRKSLKQAGLPASDLKEILSQIEKIEEELESRNPWQGFAKNGKAVFSYAKKMRDLEKQRAQQQKILDGSSVNYANFSELLAKAEQDLNKIAKEKGVDSVEYNAQLSLVNNLSKSTNEYAQNMKDAESQIADTNREMSKLTDSTLDFETQIRDIVDTTGQLANAVLNVVDSFNSLDETTKEIADETIKMAEELVNAGVAIGKIVASEGTDFKSWAQLAISVANMVASAFNIGDADKRKDVEKHQRSVEKLMKSYERLEGQISEAWNLQDIAAYNKEMQESLNNAIEAQKAAIEAQKARKGAGNENSEVAKELEAMEEELIDMESRLAEVTENTFSKLTAGIYDDIASTARAVTDAWYDSFAETGDGLKGLEENFKDTFLNIAREQAALQITGAYVDQWKEALGNFINDDDKKLTPEEAAEWAEQVKSTFPQLSSALDAFLGTIHEGLGVTGGDGLTGLQKGIQGITAEQSDILAAHLNNIANVLMTNDTAFNPMLAELRGIQQYAKNMHEMMTRWDNGTNAMRVEVI